MQDEHIRRYLMDGELFPREWSEDRMRDSERLWTERGVGLSLAFDCESGELAGFCGFLVIPTLHPEPQLVYALLERFTGITRSAIADARAAAGFTSIVAGVDEVNVASINVLEKWVSSAPRRAKARLGTLSCTNYPHDRLLSRPAGVVAAVLAARPLRRGGGRLPAAVGAVAAAWNGDDARARIGGGSFASHLSEQFTLTLTDLSEGMLAQSRLVNPGAEHIAGDMRTLRLGREFDYVLVHDAVCYMTDLRDLKAAVETAAVHCKSGGTVIVLPDFVKETFTPGTDEGGEDGADGRGFRYLEWSWDPDPNDTTYVVDYAFLLREANGDVRAVQIGTSRDLSARHLAGGVRRRRPAGNERPRQMGTRRLLARQP